MLYMPKQLTFSKSYIIFFYLVVLFKNYLFVTTQLNLKFCCQSYDVILQPKTVKIEKQKISNCLEYKILQNSRPFITVILHSYRPRE